MSKDKINEIKKEYEFIKESYFGKLNLKTYERNLKVNQETFEPMAEWANHENFVIIFNENPELMEFLNEKVYGLNGKIIAVNSPTCIDPTNTKKYIDFDNRKKPEFLFLEEKPYNIDIIRNEILHIIQDDIAALKNQKGFITNYFVYTLSFNELSINLRANTSSNSVSLERGMQEPFSESIEDIFKKQE